jgi:hypothetical protein
VNLRRFVTFGASSPALRAHVGPAWQMPAAVCSVAAARAKRLPQR